MSQATAPPSSDQLPDINQQSYPFTKVMGQLDGSVVLMMYSVPHPGASSGTGNKTAISLDQDLHRFQVHTDGPNLETSNSVREHVGAFRQRLRFIPHDFAATPDAAVPPVPFDPSVSQRFVLEEGIYRLGDGTTTFRAFGSGQTHPDFHRDGSAVQIGAIATVVEGEGQAAGCYGTLTFCGTLSPERGFEGVVLVRLFDPSRKLCASASGPLANPGSPARNISPTGSFLLIRGQKGGSDVKTTYTFGPDHEMRGLNVHQEMHALTCDFALDSSGKIDATYTPGDNFGSMEAEVLFNLLNPGAPGTDYSPIPFQSRNQFFFGPEDSRSNLQVEGGDEGRTFNLYLGGLPGQTALRFGITGPASNGTGRFKDHKVFLLDNSAVGVAPHAVSTIYLLQLVPTGPSASRHSTPSRRLPDKVTHGPARPDPFLDLIPNLNRHADHYIKWRDGFRRHADRFAYAIVKQFRKIQSYGNFPGREIDPFLLAHAFRSPVPRFNPETFERYGGPAEATFRVYDADGKEFTTSDLKSYWDPRTIRSQGWYAKRITGSFQRLFLPGEPIDLSANAVDLTLNAYREDVGVVSWVEMFQHGRQQRTCISYRLASPHEVLWFVHDVGAHTDPDGPHEFLLSHEWKEHHHGETTYPMILQSFEFDFKTGAARALTEKPISRALYREI